MSTYVEGRHAAPEDHGDDAPEPDRRFLSFGPGWIGAALFAWLVTTLVALALVVYALGPMLQSSDQRKALGEIRAEIALALGASQSLFGAAPPTKPVEFGKPVAVLEIPALKQGKPAATPAEIRTALVSTAIDLGAPGFDPVTGAGVIMTDPALAALGVAPK